MAVIPRSCFVSSCRISHFGMKPVSGGSPPRDRRIRGIRVEMMGALAHEIVRVPIVVVLFIMKTRNVEDVIIMYRVRVMTAKAGEN